MIKTKNKEFHQILVDTNNRDNLHTKYGAGWSYNDKITEILANFETALSIIDNCENCKTKFKKAVPSSK